MILVHMMGGLGGQLFQYSVARKLSSINNRRILFITHTLDLKGRNNPNMTPRDFNLDKFNTIGDVANVSDVLGIVGQNVVFIVENSPAFCKKYLEVQQSTYLIGQFGSYKYFSDIRETITKEITVKTPLGGTNSIVMDMIKNSKSVCVHVRRGDYLKIKDESHVSRLCSFNFYKECIDHIAEKIGKDITLYVFSDDPYWVQKNWRFQYETIYVCHNSDADAHEDLRLMSSCQHFVVPNSTFSWWAAWLGQHSDKIVCVAKKWVADNFDNSDLLPEEWIQFDNKL